MNGEQPGRPSDGSGRKAQPQSARELKFRRLAGELRRNVIDGTWPPGSKLPTEQALSTETGLSITTVRRAYEELVDQGLVVRRQGAGTFVAAEVAPNPQGQRVVGVLVPDTVLYYPRAIQGIEQALSQAHARLVLASSHYEREAEDAAITQLLASGVHGLLLVPTLHELADPTARAAHLLSLPVPVVLVERRFAAAGPADATEHVCTDHEGGAYDAVRHLRDLGHVRIGLVLRTDGPPAAPITSGFERALADFALPWIPRQQDRRDAWDAERADLAVAGLRAEGVTAVLCFGDREASLLLGAARRSGVTVPDDLAIIAYDNEYADVAEVPLTAVSPPKFRLGQLAAQVLLQRMEHGAGFPIHQIHLRPRLIVRASCGGARSGAGR
ncbi:GntR family transcriptional regulator [Streptomyces beijiangensis]|uniref:Substrate-binding domain-containing protein n=1 Tax=Streptomyces beijiangensis TaxID=163361 RepID=A0A939JGC5_9ACTN|nr:substrate-binding domain-containing protein [Streptomyces beijiangensis]MBO0510364.1 substrate-binding domain-containing protein [Streptomyces beijiangensis]